MKNCILIAFLFVAFNMSPLMSQINSIGLFQNAADIGKPKNAGSSRYDSVTQSYYLKGSGYNIWFNRDEFHYLYKKMKGDFILTANFELLGVGKDPHRKIGWMVRANAQEDAPHMTATVHGDGLTALQWRELRGAFMRDPEDEIFFPKKGLQTIQLERSGKKMSMRVANWGEPLQLVGSHEMPVFGDSVLVGLFINAHNAEAVEEARIWNVRVDQLAAINTPSITGSRLEIINPFDGVRKVIHQEPKGFEAPNWMPDGKRLLYNQGGSIFIIPTEGGVPEKLNTDFANRCNNDHGISFDGKLLAISHNRETSGSSSTVYVLPLTGGVPKQITTQIPSYWHGWHPNNKEVLIVGQRDGNKTYNLYKVSTVDSKETALTNYTKGHVDGPEYSPDGKMIYYNGSQSGTMQLWRMKPDGSDKEQLTFDEYHNWFPHISPDGKWIVFISFPPDLNPPDAHPQNKRVMLRLMPVSGGAPKVIAHFYGGQGTINVPSWSPDSKRLSFVSYGW